MNGMNAILRDFEQRVEFCYVRRGMLPIKEQSAIEDFRKLLQTRPDAESLGMGVWEPSKNQINYVNRIYEML